jgi:hypothetical protein
VPLGDAYCLVFDGTRVRIDEYGGVRGLFAHTRCLPTSVASASVQPCRH